MEQGGEEVDTLGGKRREGRVSRPVVELLQTVERIGWHISAARRETDV